MKNLSEIVIIINLKYLKKQKIKNFTHNTY